MQSWQFFVLVFLFQAFADAQAAGDVYFVKHAGTDCEKKGLVEGTFGKEIYTDWGMWDVVHILDKPEAMDSMLKKAKQLGGNRVVIERVDGEYLKQRHMYPGDYGSSSNTTLVSAIIRGVVYACK